MRIAAISCWSCCNCAESAAHSDGEAIASASRVAEKGIERFMVTSIRKMGEPARSCDRADTGERDWKAPRRGAGRGLGALRPRGVRPVSAAPVRRRP